MDNNQVVSIIISGDAIVTASSLINANSVPDAVNAQVRAVQRRLAIFLHHVMMLPSEIDFARRDFLMHLERNWLGYRNAVGGRPDLTFVAYADGLGYLARLHSLLYELKAFLDLFARFACRLISNKPAPHGFNKGVVNGSNIAGGRFINWIDGHSEGDVPHSAELSNRLFRASEGWITSVVEIRDTLVHKHDLPGFFHMRVPVSNGPYNIKISDIVPPAMPDGKDLISFSQDIRNLLCSLISELLPLLPRVKEEMNEKWSNAMCSNNL